MITRYRVIGGAVAALLLLIMVAPHSASAQTPPGGRPCAAGEKEQVSTVTFVSATFFFDPFFGFFTVTANTTRTTYTNYRNVTSLIYIKIVRPDGSTTDAYSFPAYLQQAYGGNLDSITQDLKAGYLHDRGAC